MCTSDGRLHVCTLQHGVLFSQRLDLSPPEQGACFLALQWVDKDENGFLIALLYDCDLLLFSDLSTQLLRQYLESEDTSSLITQRNTASLLRFSFHDVFSRITSFAMESNESFLIAGEGTEDLIRVRLVDNHTGIVSHLPHGILHGGFITKIYIEGMLLLVLYDDGSLFCLHRISFAPLSYLFHHSIVDVILLPSSLSPTLHQATVLAIVQHNEEQVLLAASIRFGAMTILGEEDRGEWLRFLSCHHRYFMLLSHSIHRKENQRSSTTMILYHLQIATEMQQLVVTDSFVLGCRCFSSRIRLSRPTSLQRFISWILR